MTELEEKEAALKNIQDTAIDAAEKYVAKNVKELLAKEVGSKEAKDLIKVIAKEALDSMEIKEDDGKSTALKTIIKEMQSQHDGLAIMVKDLKTGKEVGAVKSFSQELNEQVSLNEASLKSMLDNANASVNFTMKAAGTITIAGNYSGGVVGLTNWDSEFTRIQRRKPFIRELVRVLTTNNMYIAWAEQANPDPGVAGTVAEGAAKPQTDFDIVESSKKVEKVAAWIKVSKEALADLSFLQSEINTELRELIELKLDEQILSGNNTSPNLKGILGYAPTFAPGAEFVGNVPGANKYDVIVAAVSQIAASNFMADVVILNPQDYYSMMLIKNTQNTYNRPIFIDDSGMRIAGLRVVMNNGVTLGTFVVGDFKKDNLAIREEFNIQIGYVNSDFTNNLVTILAEMRAVNYIKTNHVNAFVQGNFTTAIALINDTTT